MFVAAPPADAIGPLTLVRTGSSSGSSSTSLVRSSTTGPTWEDIALVMQRSIVDTNMMVRETVQMIGQLAVRQEQNHAALRQQVHEQVQQVEQQVGQQVRQVEQQVGQQVRQVEGQVQNVEQQLVQLRAQISENSSRLPDGQLSRDQLMLVEFIVRYGMDTKRGHVVAFPVMTKPRANATQDKLYLAICTPLVHELFMAMFKNEFGDKFKNKTDVNRLLDDKLNGPKMCAEHRFLDKLFAHVELKRNMQLKKVFVLADVRYFYNAWRTVAGREQLPQLPAFELDQLSFSRTQRSVWTDEAETKWGMQDAKSLTKMAWSYAVQREVLVEYNKAVHAFMREAMVIQDREADWTVPEGEVFHFNGFTYVSPHECKVKKAVSLLPRTHRDYASSSSSEESSSGESSSDEAPAASSGSSSAAAAGAAGAGAPRPQGKEYAAVMRQRQQERERKRRMKAKRDKREKRRRSRSRSSDTDDRVRSSSSGSSSSSESSSSDFEPKTDRRKKQKK